MKRRDFLKYLSSATLFVPSLWHGKLAANAPTDENDRFWFCFNAQGGWDPCFSSDPVAHERYSFYTQDQVGVAGNLTFPPYLIDGDQVTYHQTAGIAGEPTQDFFAKYQNDLVLVRGIDIETNSHSVGQRTMWSGTSREGFPSIGALISAFHADTSGVTLPISWLSTGGYDTSADLVPITRIGQPQSLRDISEPYLSPYGYPEERFSYFHEETIQLMLEHQRSRTQRLTQQTNLPPHIKATIDRVNVSRGAEPVFSNLSAGLDSVTPMAGVNDPFANHRLIPKARIALAGMKAGVSKAAMLGFGGFDTHQNHDNLNGHRLRTQELFETVDYVVESMKEAGLWDRTNIIIGSDFARTRYNKTPDDDDFEMKGKDHWPITSMMFMGADFEGGRVVGESYISEDDTKRGVLARKVKVVGGVLEPASDDDPDASFIRMGDIHNSLRRIAGANNHAYADDFDLGADFITELPILRST
jgi:hypothetical protein